ncbi:hypothetical protein KUF71_021532 [Frankliniella fusca]|uniref:Uncharacterized protein n=1 Tax=Frankliniella fusca TaxID=407009 RepID=A0AAE1GZX5_9NEOP|nr:hypothetical protein KUF71_021532 [Frankliniella fusca]
MLGLPAVHGHDELLGDAPVQPRVGPGHVVLRHGPGLGLGAGLVGVPVPLTAVPAVPAQALVRRQRRHLLQPKRPGQSSRARSSLKQRCPICLAMMVMVLHECDEDRVLYMPYFRKYKGLMDGPQDIGMQAVPSLNGTDRPGASRPKQTISFCFQSDTNFRCDKEKFFSWTKIKLAILKRKPRRKCHSTPADRGQERSSFYDFPVLPDTKLMAPPQTPAPTLDMEARCSMARTPNTTMSTPSSACTQPRKRKAFSSLVLPARPEDTSETVVVVEVASRPRWWWWPAPTWGEGCGQAPPGPSRPSRERVLSEEAVLVGLECSLEEAVSSEEAVPGGLLEPGWCGAAGGSASAADMVLTPLDASLPSFGDGGGDLATKPTGVSTGVVHAVHEASSESALVMVSTVLMSESMAEDMMAEAYGVELVVVVLISLVYGVAMVMLYLSAEITWRRG